MPGQPLIEVTGSGPDLVLVHGWGMHRGVWGRAARDLAMHHRLHLVDLPGHGTARGEVLDDDLSALASGIMERVPEASWLGWSMGGLIALPALLDNGACRAIRHGERCWSPATPLSWSGQIGLKAFQRTFSSILPTS